MNFITGKLRCSTENKNLSTTSTTEKHLKSQAKTFCKGNRVKKWHWYDFSSKYQFSFNNLSTIAKELISTPAVPKDLSL